MSELRPITVLLVEDSPGDIRLTEEALRESKLKVNLESVQDGELAIAYLRRQGNYREAIRPDLILLDLNMPRKDGREVLAEVKADPELKTIPIVVLTMSASEADVERAYELQANCYITKPVNLDQFIKVIAAINDFWLTIVSIPGNVKHDD